MATAAAISTDIRQHALLAPPPALYPLQRSDGDPDSRNMHTSTWTPSSASHNPNPLLSDALPRSHTVSPPFVSSPLNTNTPIQASSPPSLFTGLGTQSRQSMIFNRIASEDTQALTQTHRSSLSASHTRASMILYRLAEEYEQRTISPYFMNRHSLLSNSGDSTFTLSYDSKYPAGPHSSPNKLVAYPFDPATHIDTPEEDDALHDPSDNSTLDASPGIALRGYVNIGVLILVILALLCLFIFYPVWHYVTAIKNSGTTVS